MKFEIDVQKKHFIAIVGAILILAGAFSVYAYNTNNPAYFGHSGGEIGKVADSAHADTADSANTANSVPWSGITGKPTIPGPSRLSWSDSLTRIVVDGGGNNAAVSYADNANYANSAGVANSLAGGFSPSSCQLCIQTGTDNCDTQDPKRLSDWVCAPLSGGVSAWTGHTNGNCARIKIQC